MKNEEKIILLLERFDFLISNNEREIPPYYPIFLQAGLSVPSSKNYSSRSDYLSVVRGVELYALFLLLEERSNMSIWEELINCVSSSSIVNTEDVIEIIFILYRMFELEDNGSSEKLVVGELGFDIPFLFFKDIKKEEKKKITYQETFSMWCKKKEYEKLLSFYGKINIKKDV